ncbi:hypothetical protein A2U01_0008704, partial [Trifolium medium]|nr:hypothetical protein [Trifolium medium]
DRLVHLPDCSQYPTISETDSEEVILNFLQSIKDTGVTVPRNKVPPAPSCDPHGARQKRKKTTSEGEPAKEAKKARVEKKSSGGIKIGTFETRTKKKHEKNAGKDDSETESDERPLDERLKQRTKAETAKAFQKQFSKGKSTESIIDNSSEAP